MTLPTFAPPVSPSVNSQKTVQPRVLKAEFGDGYRQRAADGLNSRPAAWDLKWDALTTADADAIEGFLAARGGVEAFWWTPLDAATPLKFVAESWGRAPIVGAEARSARRRSISAKLTHVRDLRGPPDEQRQDRARGPTPRAEPLCRPVPTRRHPARRRGLRLHAERLRGGPAGLRRRHLHADRHRGRGLGVERHRRPAHAEAAHLQRQPGVFRAGRHL